MSDNDPRCAKCGRYRGEHVHARRDLNCGHEHHTFRPYPAPPSGLTAEQRAELEQIGTLWGLRPAIRAALAEIDALQEAHEHERNNADILRLERDKWMEDARLRARNTEDAQAERDALRAENERLQRECESLAATQCESPMYDDGGSMVCVKMHGLANDLVVAKREADALRALVAEMVGPKHSCTVEAVNIPASSLTCPICAKARAALAKK